MTTATTLSGIVKWFNEAKGFGFIVRDDHRDDIFCHITQVAEHCDYPKKGDRVSFIEDTGRDGRLYARQVVLVESGVQGDRA